MNGLTVGTEKVVGIVMDGKAREKSKGLKVENPCPNAID